MRTPEAAPVRPRHKLRVAVMDLVIRILVCLHMTLAAWYYSMARPSVESGVIRMTYDGYIASRTLPTANGSTFDVHQRPALKVHSQLPYTDLMSLLQDTKADGSVNEDIYRGASFTVWKYMLPFISWDGERMVKISLDDLFYGSEESAAFFPLLPWLSNIGGRGLRCLHLVIAKRCGYDPDSVEAPKVIYVGLAGLLVSNLCGILATVALYVLAWEILHRRKLLADSTTLVPPLRNSQGDDTTDYEYIEKVAYLAALMLCFSQSTVHRIGIYTENPFCLLTFTGLLALLAAEDNRKVAYYVSKNKMIAYAKAYLFEAVAVCLFFTCSMLRSNGVVILMPLFFYTFRTCSLFCRLDMFHAYDTGSLGVQGSGQHGEMSLLAPIRFLLHWLRALIYALLIMAPMAIFQLYIYCLYCLHLTHDQLEMIRRFPDFIKLLVSPEGWNTMRGILASQKLAARPWCSFKVPRVYGFVQKEYWDVGFLWVLRDPLRLHVFLYCGHTYVVTYLALRHYYTYLKTTYSNITEHIGKSKQSSGSWSLKPFVTLMSNAEVGLHVYMLITALTFLLFAHTHVYMRQTLPLVSYLLYVGAMVEPLFGQGQSLMELVKKGRKFQLTLLFLFFNTLLCFLGGALFATFLGFT
ncbi:gpi mannosyltransferase 2 like protein [Babesia gibsoni]|uniref:GPI mannosyltransferase 2 n=1 Tax=Babesia gibsoni TaxID=33632 RepID=A0AAD8PD86_BABGI|nr:gpi mannosyltransferase 2 like protein [Babesia gibsoni]